MITVSRLNEIAKNVNEAHAEIEQVLQASLSRALEVGKLLTEAKTLVGHGDWLKWIADNCVFSERTAQNYMRLSARYPELKSATIADLTYHEAIGLLAEPKQNTGVLDSDNWIERLEWANKELERIKTLKTTPIKSSGWHTDLTPAQRMLTTAQELIKIDELNEAIEKYISVICGAMREAAEDDIFPMLSAELQNKVNDYVAFANEAALA